MSQMKDMNQRIHKLKNGLGISLVINWLVPIILYTVLRYFITNDTVTFAIVIAIPVLRTIFMFVLRHRIDWIGVFGIFGFVIALVTSSFSGGSSLPLKLYHPILTGTLGVIFLISVIIKKPLLLSVLKYFKQGNLEQLDNPRFHNQLAIMSLVVGLLLLIDSLAHIFMALTLPTGTYLGMSKLVTIAILVIVVGLRWLSSRRKLN
jgi:hypothetical protein